MPDPFENTDRKLNIHFLFSRRAEYSPLIEAFSGTEEKICQNRSYCSLETGDFNIRWIHIGIGEKQVGKTLRDLTPIPEPDLIVMSGTCGSVRDDLTPGSFFSASAVIAEDTDNWLYPEIDQLNWLKNQCESHDLVLRTGPMVTVEQPVKSRKKRQFIAQQYQAQAVDMESFHAIRFFENVMDSSPAWFVFKTVSDSPSTAETVEELEKKQEPAIQQLGQGLEKIIESLC